ncbi:MAG: nucleoside permease [Delftia acidovorans]|nr:nucleoside permease [Delftia acidovorans]
MKTTTGVQLAFMMFVQYFIWSAWYVTMGTYMGTNLHSSDKEIGMAFSALAIATMISPFFIGMVADRYFAAQKIMGVLHLVGALLLFLTPTIHNNDVFFWIILLYSILYMPTIALSNSVFGTLGWIVAGLLVGNLGWEKSQATFQLAAAASVLLGLVSFFLPNTPPKGVATDASASLGVEAFILFRNRPYLIFFIAAILVCVPLSFYYGFANPFLNELGMKNAAGKMIMGQLSEGLFIMAIPFLFNSIGVKKMLLLGMTAWILRYICFAYGNIGPAEWMLYAGIILHGVCYDFFFVTGYMYTEKKAGESIKNAAQGLFTFATYGLGMFIGTWFSGVIVNGYAFPTIPVTHDWKSIWLVPAYIAAAVLIYFILFFREKKQLSANQ